MRPNLVNKNNVPLTDEMRYNIMEYNLLHDIQKLMSFKDIGIYESKLGEMLRTRNLDNFNINKFLVSSYFKFIYGDRDQFTSTSEALVVIYKWKFLIGMGFSPKLNMGLEKELGYLSIDMFYDDKAELYWKPEYMREIPFEIIKGHIREHMKYCIPNREEKEKLEELILSAKYIKAIKLDKDELVDTFYGQTMPFMKNYEYCEYFGFTENIAFYCNMFKES